jgi:YidC/Oxa1 family membrane protein insertase
MERRVLLAIFLSFLVLYGYQTLFVPPPETPAATDSSSTGAPGSTAAPGSAATAPNSAPALERSPADPAAPAGDTGLNRPAPVVSESTEREVRLETDTVVATFTNRGARLKSYRLKKYTDSRGEALELVPQGLPAPQVLPFSLSINADPATTATLNDVLFTVTESPSQVTFEYRDAGGLTASKSFQTDASAYVLTVRASVSQGDRRLTPVVHWGPALGVEPTTTGAYAVLARGILFSDGELVRLDASDLAEQSAYEGSFTFAGVDDQYFVTAVLNPGAAKVQFQPVTMPPAEPEGTPTALVAYAVETPVRAEPLRFFAGPKDFDVLAAVDRNFVRAIDFGIFSIIVVPLLRSLKWINGFVGNYGWSIVILTVLINALMFPLRHKSVVSMRRMQEIQPEAKAIQERYAKLKATDPAKQKMNQELMALYRERGVNPASGCVPMLLTLPVLFAFYALLVTAIELRGAPFFGWIQDLSRYDPYYVTPVLMGLTQIWQQRLTPQTGVDPAQQKLMMFMPVMFMFFFLWAPAGVALYWFISNLWGIGQQYLTNYMIGPPNIRTVRPAAERRVKRVGSGKTDKAAREE